MNMSEVWLVDDGTLDTVISNGFYTVRFDSEAVIGYRDEDGTFDLEKFLEENPEVVDILEEGGDE